MDALEWEEECGTCRGVLSVHMQHEGRGSAACGFCGRIEQWSEPDGMVRSEGGVGCCVLHVRDLRSTSQGMSRRELMKARLMLGAGARRRKAGGNLRLGLVTRRCGAGQWEVTALVGKTMSCSWTVRTRSAQTVVGVMTRGLWSEGLEERLREKRLVRGKVVRGLSRAKARWHGGNAQSAGGACAAEDEWGEVPL